MNDMWWKALTCIVIIQISGSGCCIIEGVLNGDILLPCFITYHTAFNNETFVVHWQTTLTLEVLHSFHYGIEQDKYQQERFKGRAQFFPQEFSKGNISLLLRNLQTSDTGNYSCRVYLGDEADDEIVHHVELYIKDPKEESSTGHKGFSALFFYVVLLAAVPLVTFLVLRWKKTTSRSSEFNG